MRLRTAIFSQAKARREINLAEIANHCYTFLIGSSITKFNRVSRYEYSFGISLLCGLQVYCPNIFNPAGAATSLNAAGFWYLAVCPNDAAS